MGGGDVLAEGTGGLGGGEIEEGGHHAVGGIADHKDGVGVRRGGYNIVIDLLEGSDHKDIIFDVKGGGEVQSPHRCFDVVEPPRSRVPERVPIGPQPLVLRDGDRREGTGIHHCHREGQLCQSPDRLLRMVRDKVQGREGVLRDVIVAVVDVLRRREGTDVDVNYGEHPMGRGFSEGPLKPLGAWLNRWERSQSRGVLIGPIRHRQPPLRGIYEGLRRSKVRGPRGAYEGGLGRVAGAVAEPPTALPAGVTAVAEALIHRLEAVRASSMSSMTSPETTVATPASPEAAAADAVPHPLPALGATSGPAVAATAAVQGAPSYSAGVAVTESVRREHLL